MTLPPTVFEDGYRTDTVTAVLLPIDGLSRRPIVRGIRAWLWDKDKAQPRPFSLVKNLSGHFVLLNQPADAVYDFRLDPSRAGYRDPVDVSFNPETEGVSRLVRLERRADYPFEDGLTLVRGKVERGDGDDSVAVPGVIVSVRPGPGLADTQVPVTTDAKGSFVAVIRPAIEISDSEPEPIDLTLRFDPSPDPVRDLQVKVDRFQTHIFSKPIKIDGDTTPPFHPHDEGEDEQ